MSRLSIGISCSKWEFGPILMDEITGVADSNEGAALPSAVGNKLAQLRRADVTVRITGLNFIRANKRIREAVTAITRCSATWGVIAVSEDGSERVWKQNRWASWRTYDAQSLPLDDHTESAYEKAELWSRLIIGFLRPLRSGLMTPMRRCSR